MTKKNKKEFYKNDNSLYWLAESVTKAIENNEDGTFQKEQVEVLMELEEKFRRSLLKYRQTTEIYRMFIMMVVVQNRNILSARPYFREKSDVFSSKITPAIKTGQVKVLQSFHINYLLIKFIKDNWVGPFPERAQKFYNKALVARRKLIENNIPLAINRAKLFYRKVPKGQLSLMDMIGIASTGLISGVDKWVGEYTPVFRSVCIGRMGGNMIDSYSDTMLHFYPSDRHILYRANSIAYREGIEDYESLAGAINKSFDQDKTEGRKSSTKPISSSELASLMKAASVMSATLPFDPEANCTTLFDVEDLNPNEEDMEDSIANREALSKTLAAASKLSILHQKILKLKGVKL
mgnify:CR=1 FL=1|jgi:hypothetical protein